MKSVVTILIRLNSVVHGFVAELFSLRAIHRRRNEIKNTKGFSMMITFKCLVVFQRMDFFSIRFSSPKHAFAEIDALITLIIAILRSHDMSKCIFGITIMSLTCACVLLYLRKLILYVGATNIFFFAE